jgi:short-subunit dehydrogenase
VLIACPGFTASNIRNTALSADGSAQKESPRDETKMMTSEQVADEIYKAVENKQQRLILTFEGKMAVFLSKLFPKLISKLVFNKLAKEPNSPIKD